MEERLLKRLKICLRQVLELKRLDTSSFAIGDFTEVQKSSCGSCDHLSFISNIINKPGAIIRDGDRNEMLL